MPKSETYWKNRANQRFAESEKYSEAQINRIWGIYNEAQKDLQKMINEIYSSYAGQSGLDREMMERIINSADLKQLINQVKKESGKDITEQVMRNYKGRINRLQALQLRLQAKAEQLTNKVENAATATLKSVTEQSYRRTMYDIGKAENFNSASFATLDDRTIDQMLKTKWVANGNYSQRIWKNENQLVNKLDSLLTRGAMTGMSYERMSMELRQSFQTEKYKADRLIRTEMAYFHNEAEKECYEDLGIDQYIYIATLDDRTSEVCRDLDGKVFKTKDGQAGKNMPPMHPNCRSTTGPYYDDDNIEEWTRRARNDEGKNEVIKYKTYREWEADLAKQGKTPGPIKGMEPNDYNKEQYERYTKVLGDMVPGTLEEFVKLKGNPEQWNDLKAKYRTVNRYKVDYGHVEPKTILELDKIALKNKDSFTNSALRRDGNIATLKIDNKIFIASSKIDNRESKNYSKFAGDKEKLVFLSEKPAYITAKKGDMVDGKKSKHDRAKDTEAKMFEFIRETHTDKNASFEFTILSERNMCESCRGVYEQFMIEYPNAKVNVVSGKQITKTKIIDGEEKEIEVSPWDWRKRASVQK